MIRIEVEIDERVPGRVDVFCRSFESCWRDSTAAEKEAANRITTVMRRDIEVVSRTFGTVETFSGDAMERLRREGQL